MEIRQKLVSPSKYDIKCPYALNPTYITFHNTYNDASADDEVSYMIRNDNEISFHIAVDDVEAVQGIPFNRNAWHCGDGGKGTGNRNSIGVEICYSKSGGSRYVKAEENGVQLIAQLMVQFNIPIERVVPHQKWSGKYCPHRILAEGRLQSFVARIQAAYLALTKKPAAAKPVTTVKPVPAPVKPAAPKAAPQSIVPFPGLLKVGSRGKDVERVQRAVGVEADGIFGKATEAAVKAYQKRKGLTADGLVGINTWNMMF